MKWFGDNCRHLQASLDLLRFLKVYTQCGVLCAFCGFCFLDVSMKQTQPCFCLELQDSWAGPRAGTVVKASQEGALYLCSLKKTASMERHFTNTSF